MVEKETKILINDNQKAAIFFGTGDENFKHLKQLCDADVSARGSDIHIKGQKESVDKAYNLIHSLLDIVQDKGELNINDINYISNIYKEGNKPRRQDIVSGTILTTARGKTIKAKTIGQKKYIQAILHNDIVFGVGPAGTGKTYLAVVMAVRALRNKDVERIILVRPAVEAGEKLGFLPGDFIEKVNPYLRPLYDGLFDILGVDVTQRYLEKNIIEIAPLAYMRGRTLNDAFIILDEAQNTTPQQMKMFLTRLGFGSKAIITGDVTQVDLPKDDYSGLIEVQKILSSVKGVAFEYLSKKDVVRHPLVQEIIDAYEIYEDE
ncbi:Phosphate starvation-inducible protein PhoH, predicted ATPase [Candidatus Syntrophocurvum alkaliphilum]|uniref:PhoH-like protein n=1 Tax=Candidatus Syntrophocurvum alkaliphilum TaxID=2293317 RepID=A0A6I6DFU0_9FIRM|nr:PhoH family protein [Candidatus Syntrophocurvum alkaliphilum]QGT99986.1 Phosphate starvation-inducible protein PhoH, predicted ATPase [Candidatus Syntrophocurvum alkaliphilum]